MPVRRDQTIIKHFHVAWVGEHSHGLCLQRDVGCPSAIFNGAPNMLSEAVVCCMVRLAFRLFPCYLSFSLIMPIAVSWHVIVWNALKLWILLCISGENILFCRFIVEIINSAAHNVTIDFVACGELQNVDDIVTDIPVLSCCSLSFST